MINQTSKIFYIWSNFETEWLHSTMVIKLASLSSIPSCPGSDSQRSDYTTLPNYMRFFSPPTRGLPPLPPPPFTQPPTLLQVS